MLTIGITGAGGHLGRLVLQHLRVQAPAGVRVVALSRRPDQIAGGAFDEARRADFNDPASLDPAFAGLDRLLVVSIEGDDEMRVRAHAQAALAARRAGVQRLVYTSFFDVDPGSPSVVARVHRDSEAAFRASGVDSVFLRDGPYADNMVLRVATAAREGGVFRMPGGDARLPYIGRDDLARAAVAALLAGTLAQPAWRLSGPELLSFGALCAQVGTALGLPVRYQPMSDLEYQQELASEGLPPELQRRRLAYVAAMRAGFMTALTDDFERLTGHRPRRLQDLLPGFDLSPGQRLH